MTLTILSKALSGMLLIGAVWVSAYEGMAAEAEPGVLTRISDLRAMTRENAAKLPAVHVRGVITWLRLAGWNSFCVQDDSAGIWVAAGLAESKMIWDGDQAVLDSLREGMEVEVQGVLDPGDFSPQILPRTVRVLGMKTVPPAGPISLTRLFSGAEDCQRVEVTGVVHRCVRSDSDWLLHVETGIGSILARIPQGGNLTPETMVDSKVRLQGLAASRFNARSEHTLPGIFVSRPEDLSIMQAAPTDAFSTPKVSFFALGHVPPEGRPLHRRRIEGLVTYFKPGAFCYLQDDSGCAVKVSTDSKDPLQPGDRVEASGFITEARPVAGLVEALVRKAGTAVAPEPIATDLAQIKRAFQTTNFKRRAALPHDYDGRLVSVEGRLLSVQRDATEGGRQVLIECGGSLTTGELSGDLAGADGARLDQLRPGRRLRLSGVAVLQYAGSMAEFASPKRLDLLLRGVDDVAVLNAASGWTSRRLVGALLGLGVILFGALLCIFSLRRLFQRRATRLEEVMRAHRVAELELKSEIRERPRLALDQHDGPDSKSS